MIGEIVWDPKSRTSELFVYKEAFAKEELLDLVVGHEVMHHKFFLHRTSLGVPRFDLMYNGAIEHEVIFGWMHNSYKLDHLGATSSPFDHLIGEGIYYMFSPIVNPF